MTSANQHQASSGPFPCEADPRQRNRFSLTLACSTRESGGKTEADDFKRLRNKDLGQSRGVPPRRDPSGMPSAADTCVPR